MKLKTLSIVLFSLLSLSTFSQSIDALGIRDSKFVPVIIGGWGSCDSLRSQAEKKQFGNQTPHQMFLYEQALRYVQTINASAERGIEKMVMICANKWSQSGIFSQGEIRLKTYSVNGQTISMDEEDSEIVNLDSYQDSSLGVILRSFPEKDQRPHLTTRLLEIAQGSPLVLIGHSYGGWIGKRIIEILAAPELYEDSKIQRNRQLFFETTKLLKSYSEFPVHTFFSLEGISAVNCSVEKSLFTGLQTIIAPKEGQRTMGCRQEFKSFDEELKSLSSHPLSLPLEESVSKVTHWYNIMLKNSTLSTRARVSFTPGIQNIMIDVLPYGPKQDYKKSQMHPFKNAHHMLGFAALTWNTLCELSLKDQSLCNAIEFPDNKGRQN